jgi:hypothetical protein
MQPVALPQPPLRPGEGQMTFSLNLNFDLNLRLALDCASPACRFGLNRNRIGRFLLEAMAS